MGLNLYPCPAHYVTFVPLRLLRSESGGGGGGGIKARNGRSELPGLLLSEEVSVLLQRLFVGITYWTVAADCATHARDFSSYLEPRRSAEISPTYSGAFGSNLFGSNENT